MTCACQALHVSESTVTLLEETFKNLAHKLCKFQCDTCSTFNTKELPKEIVACHQAASQYSNTATTPLELRGARLKKLFNLSTYKFHAMGDYVSIIRLFGSTDPFAINGTYILLYCYLLEVKILLWELAHRALKAFYPLTSKLDTCAQLAKHKCRYHVLWQVAEAEADQYTLENIMVLQQHIRANQLIYSLYIIWPLLSWFCL